MPDLNLALRLTADGKGFVGEVRVARQEMDKLTGASSRAGRGARRQATGQQAANAAMRRAERATRAQTAALQQQTVALQAADGATGSLIARHVSLLRYASPVAAYFAGRRIFQTVDAYTELNNRLRLVTDSEAGLVAVRRELLGVSQRSFTSLTANAELYNRISLAARETGHSQAQLLRVTELLNKQVAIGGNNAAEAAAGLTQFAQGLAAGRLQGDELRSVLENLQGVSEGLITGFRLLRERGQIDFDVTRANIRELAAEGVLTARLLLDAILASAEQTERAYERVDVSISGAFTNVANATTLLIGKFDEATGFSRGLTAALQGLARVIEDFAGGRTIEEIEADIAETVAARAKAPPERRDIYDRRLANLQQQRRAAAATDDPVPPAAPSARNPAPAAATAARAAAPATQSTPATRSARRDSNPFPDLLGQAEEAQFDRLYSAGAIEQAHAARLEAERRGQRELAQQRREDERRERAAREQAFRDRLAQAAGFADAELQQQSLRDEALIALRYQSVREVGQVVALANRLQYQEGIQAIQTGLEIARQGADALASQSKAAFRIYKATAIAQTIISTYQGAQDAYASGLKVPAPAPIPQIIAVAAAAAAVAAGIGRVNAIRNQRQPQAFARGGVVDSPTFFSARGLPSGLAGEAGPEAILPLRRGPRGLGVDASVAAPRPVVIHITLGDIHVDGGDDPARAGRELSDMLVRRTRTEMRRVIADEQRPGGLLNRTGRVG